MLNISISSKVVDSLSGLSLGLGDLSWPTNLGNQILDDVTDTYYYSNGCKQLYFSQITNSEYKFLSMQNSNLVDATDSVIGKHMTWDIVSKYIVYRKNNFANKVKVLIFYDSFLTSTMHLYLAMFDEVYMIKNIYSDDTVKIINPDYVFEFRVERFLI